VGSGHARDLGRRDQHAPAPAGRHVGGHEPREVDRAADVEVDQGELALEVVATGGDARVERDRVERAAGDLRVEGLDAARRGEVDLDRLGAELGGHVMNAVPVSGDDEVKAVGGELARELEPNTARGAGHDRERSTGIRHAIGLPG
jgi:hypothetical protein